MNDRAFGAVALAFLTVAFVYYTAWALVTPLIDEGHPVLRLFPRTELSVILPGYLGGTLVLGCFFVVGAHMIAHRPAQVDSKKYR